MIAFMRPGERYLAHRVWHRGRMYPLSVISLGDDGGLSVEPFEREAHSTAFVNGPLYVLDATAAEFAAAATASPDPAEITARQLWHGSGMPLLMFF